MINCVSYNYKPFDQEQNKNLKLEKMGCSLRTPHIYHFLDFLSSSYLRRYTSSFAAMKSFTASFHAEFMGSLSNLICAISFMTFRSSLKTVAAVLVSFDTSTFFVSFAIDSTLTPPLSQCVFIYFLYNIHFLYLTLFVLKKYFVQNVQTFK